MLQLDDLLDLGRGDLADLFLVRDAGTFGDAGRLLHSAAAGGLLVTNSKVRSL